MASIHWRGRAAYLSYYDQDGRHRLSLGRISAREAEKARRLKEAQLLTGQRLAGGAPSFIEFSAKYLSWYEKEYPTSYKRVANIIAVMLMPHFQLKRLDEITVRVVDEWKTVRRGQHSRRKRKGKAGRMIRAETVNKELRQLKALLAKAVEWEAIGRHPCAKAKPLKNLDSAPPPFYTAEQLDKLYRASLNDRRWWWQFMTATGLRRSEAYNAHRDHIRPGWIRVPSTTDARTKSGKWREIPLAPAAREALDHLGESYLLPRVHPNQITRAFGKDARRAGVGGSVHWLRHTFCSQLVTAGIPLRTVQILAGHASYATTERYAHLAPDYLQGVVERMGGGLVPL